ncbi:cation diffusion facilitator family transporter [Luteithermobacter gelatinilyticus]|uniref:cation diffusion facilitator family transporter n=1 Tax=Luteithermobacter gelatinilyticus TaxID=2582913 RepID=UPI001106DDEC|nr:cation diffusion facilitator family transporter [Luteithermobacter gelatinilyticus]|tara:strand:- start:2733 stop:3674 length:942 start_codon:yes stop_codon:yes gene_type:complete
MLMGHELTEKQQNSDLMLKAARASLLVALCLIGAKTWAWMASGSVALLGSLVDSIMDLLASTVNFVAVRFAIAPADEDHRFGHGKAEAIAGLLQAVVVTLSALLLMAEAVRHLMTPEPLRNTPLGIAVIVFSIGLTFLLVAYQRHVVRKTNSVAISADSLHYAGDLLMNVAVLVALALGGYLGWRYADPLFGLGIGLYLLYNVYLIARNSINILMDREMEEEEREKIIRIVQAHDEVKGLHDMKTRRTGLEVFIQFHIELESDISLKEAHNICDEVEAELKEEFPMAEIIIHADPEDAVEEENVQFTEPEVAT